MAQDRKSLWGRLGAMFVSRPRLIVAAIIGLVVGFGAWGLYPNAPWATDFILGWDTMCLVFMISITLYMYGQGPEEMRVRAAREDEGQGIILAVVLTAAAASVYAIALQLSLAKPEHGLLRALHIALAFATVTASWLMVQLIFALHYASEYYQENEDAEGIDAKGLMFPGGEAPDYWDFLHFSVVIGVAAQTADLCFTSKELRRIGTVHSLVAFAFNTVIVALTINLLAGLFS